MGKKTETIQMTADGIQVLDAKIEYFKKLVGSKIKNEGHEQQPYNGESISSTLLYAHAERDMWQRELNGLKQDRLSVRLYESSEPPNVVDIGRCVVLKKNGNDPAAYFIAGDAIYIDISDIPAGEPAWMAAKCDLGRVILGHKVGETVEYYGPRGRPQKVEIVKVYEPK